MTSSYAGAATRTLETTIWYPADAEGNLATGGPFPLIVWSHGYSSTLFDSVRSPAWTVRMEGGTHTGFTNFASAEQPDSLGCDRIDTTNTMRDDDGGPQARYAELGGTEVGFNLPPPAEPEDAISCLTKPLPPSISGDRQRRLTSLLLTSFFDMHFDADAEQRNLSCQFLEQHVARENDELDVQTR